MTDRAGGGTAVEILADREALAERAASEVVKTLAGALAARRRASWVLAGGSTPRRHYERLAVASEAVDWPRVELFWGDERCVEPSSPASNYALARTTLLERLPLAAERVHRIRGELPPVEAARDYHATVQTALATGPFDLVLLGLGADGHTASLFPGALPGPESLVAATEAPVEPRWRVTMTPAALSRSRRTVYLVSGADKAAAVARALDPESRPRPVTDDLRSPAGETLWLLDRQAAAELP